MTVTRVEGISYLPITGTVSFDSSALLGFSVVCRFIWVFSTRLLINEESVQVRISTQLLPSNRYKAARGCQVSTREPWNKKQPIMISKDAAPIISFPMKNPTIGTVNTA